MNQMSNGWRGLVVITCAAAAMAVAGCRTEHRGPLEQAGHDVDHTARRAQHDINHPGNNTH